jgi:trigger factor
VEEELAGMVTDAKNLMAQRGVSLEQVGQNEEELFDRYRPLAERKVREILLIQRVIEQENLSLTDEILDGAYAEFAEGLGQPVDIIREHHNSDEEAFELFRQKTLEKQAIRHIMEKSQVERVEADKGEPEEE